MADVVELTNIDTKEISLVDKGANQRKYLVIKREKGMKTTVQKDETVNEMTLEQAQPLLKALAGAAEGDDKLVMDAVLKHLEAAPKPVEPEPVAKSEPVVEPVAVAEPVTSAEVTKAAEPVAVAAAAEPVAVAKSLKADLFVWGDFEEMAKAMSGMAENLTMQATAVAKSIEGQTAMLEAQAEVSKSTMETVGVGTRSA